ncbi:hypothetical protein J6590_068038 [Homalodisca vitripennis]|nr:hypothetical protein J6590_068038 [Homalodisca vitripennis]
MRRIIGVIITIDEDGKLGRDIAERVAPARRDVRQGLGVIDCAARNKSTRCKWLDGTYTRPVATFLALVSELASSYATGSTYSCIYYLVTFPPRICCVAGPQQIRRSGTLFHPWPLSSP